MPWRRCGLSRRLQQAVKPQGLLGVMSLWPGSLTNNLTGQRELYRGSKAALNYVYAQLCRSPLLGLPSAGGDGPGMDPHRARRGRCPADHRRDDPTPGERPARQTATSGTGVSGLPGPYRALVIRAGTTIHMAARKLTPPGAACYRPYSAAHSLYFRFIVQKNVNYVNRSEESCFKVNFSM